MLPPCTFPPVADAEDDCLGADVLSAGTSSTTVSRDMSVDSGLADLGTLDEGSTPASQASPPGVRSVTFDLSGLSHISDECGKNVEEQVRVEEKVLFGLSEPEKKPRKSRIYESFVELRKRGRSWVSSYVIH